MEKKASGNVIPPVNHLTLQGAEPYIERRAGGPRKSLERRILRDRRG
jgi:hypothetical protein